MTPKPLALCAGAPFRPRFISCFRGTLHHPRCPWFSPEFDFASLLAPIAAAKASSLAVAILGLSTATTSGRPCAALDSRRDDGLRSRNDGLGTRPDARGRQGPPPAGGKRRSPKMSESATQAVNKYSTGNSPQLRLTWLRRPSMSPTRRMARPRATPVKIRLLLRTFVASRRVHTPS